jgi:hypothetical protein
MPVGLLWSEKIRAILPTAALLVVALLFVGACSDGEHERTQNDPPEQKTEMTEETTPPATTLETTGGSQAPEVTLGNDSGDGPEVVIRLEGDPETTFSGLCSVGEARKVLSGQVPKRFEFAPKDQRLSCRIEKRDNQKGELKVVLAAGETTRSVQQTNTPGGVIKVAYKG